MLSRERRAPYTVWAFAAVVVAALAELVVVGRIDGWLIGGGLLLLVLSLALVQGVWFAWLLLTVVSAGDLLAVPFMWPAWGMLLVNGAMLTLLLAPPTRRYVGKPA
jgi:hypothetical protein